MKAVRVKAFGGLEQLELVELQDPQPARGEVVIDVKACGLNYADVMQREGAYPGGPKPPFLSGLEAAGIVREVGPETNHAETIGSRVAVLARGAHADRVCASARSCIPLPDGVSFEEGAAFPVQYLTAYHALVTLAHASEGETVLIHAAAGGVGTAAVQIAKLLKLKIIGTASSPEKRARLIELGVNAPVGYDDFETASRELTSGRGPDICLESIGGDVFNRTLALMPALSRLVVYGAASKQPQPIDTLRLFFRSQAVLGLHLNGILERPKLMAESITTLLQWIAAGKVKIQIGHRFPLAEVSKAHELLASRQSYGKIVLTP